MKDKTGKALAAAISELAKAIDHLATVTDRATPSRIYYGGGSPPNWGYATGGNSGGQGSGGGVGGSPGGVHPVGGGRYGGGGGGAVLTIVGEIGPEMIVANTFTGTKAG